MASRRRRTPGSEWCKTAIALLILMALSGCGYLGGREEPAVAGASVEARTVLALETEVVLTNDSWSLVVADAERYRGSAVDITGQVFNTLGDYDGASHYQLFTDPSTRGGNTHLAVASGLIQLQESDTVRVVGTLDRLLVTTSRGGDELRLPYVVANSIEVISGPTATLITPTAIPTPPITATISAITATIAPSITVAPATATITPTATPEAAPSATEAPSAKPVHFTTEASTDNIPVTANLINMGDANAPSGHYFASRTSTKGWNGTGALPADAGAATFAVEVPSDGRYAIWVRMQYETVDANSLWLRVDDRKALVFGNDDGAYGKWRWVNWQDGNAANRVIVDLGAGAHTITLAGREAGTRFDSVLVTDDAGFQPAAPAQHREFAATPSTALPNATTSLPTPPPPSPTAVLPSTTTLKANAAATSTTQPTASGAAQATGVQQPSATSTPLATATKVPSATATAQATASKMPSATATVPAKATNAPPATAQATATKAPSATATPPATATKAATPPATGTATRQRTPTSQPTNTPLAANHPDTYTVKQGDTLSSIAQQMYGDAGQFQRIYQANRDKLSSPDSIGAGTQLRIPK